MPDTLNPLKVISRKSPLALKQVTEVFNLFPELTFELITLESFGDKHKKNSLLGNSPRDIFTQELDKAILQHTADLAIYSAKDVPYPLASGLEVIALFKTLEQGNLAIVACDDSAELKSLFASKDIRRQYGNVTLVGFGPGNPDLLTLGGDKALTQADIIFHDDLLDKNFLEKYIAEKVYVGKRKDQHSFEQDDINRLILEAAQLGKQVVRLKGGDPMIFAHGGEEVEYLQRNFLKVNVIPGVSSGIAVASYTKIPLTNRGISSSVSFLLGHSKNIQIPQTDTLVYYMGGSNIRQIAQKAISQGRNPQTPVMLTYNVSMPDQQDFFSTLEELSQTEKKYPTPLIIVVGYVVSLRNKSAEEIAKPTILITGRHKEHYEQLGIIIHQPLIQIEEIEDNPELEKQLNRLDQFDWLFFTSASAVNFFFEAFFKKGKDSRSLNQLKVASVGHATSRALRLYGIVPDLQATEESSEGLLFDIQTKNIPNGRALIPRSNLGLPILPEGLAKLGWQVWILPIYKNIFPDNLKSLDLTKIQQIVFSSPSCVTNFIRLYGHFPTDKKYIFRGKETEKRYFELKKNDCIEKTKVQVG
jgi:uroporphyrinogen III methyltransferase/synthase